MWRVLLKATKIKIDTCRRDERVVGHLSSHACKLFIMKYTININQKAIVDLGLQDKLDFIDLAIYDFITEFMLCEDCQKMIVGNEQYFWIKADLIIENLPLLGISTTRGVNKRIEKLIECDLLERCPDNKNLRQSFFKVGKLYKEYKFLTWNESSKPSWNENSKSNNTMYKDTIDNNNNIDNNEEREDKSSPKKYSLDLSIVAPEMQEVVETWLAYKKEKGKIYKPIGFKNFYKKLCEMSCCNPQIAMAIIEQSMANNYEGIFPLKANNSNYARTRTQSEKLRECLVISVSLHYLRRPLWLVAQLCRGAFCYTRWRG